VEERDVVNDEDGQQRGRRDEQPTTVLLEAHGAAPFWGRARPCQEPVTARDKRP
jgi:hypothetical protein